MLSSKTSYERCSFSIGCEAAIASGHYLDITTRKRAMPSWLLRGPAPFHLKFSKSCSSTKFEVEQPTQSTDSVVIPELWKPIFPPQIIQVLL
jgi:hypothetical protein